MNNKPKLTGTLIFEEVKVFGSAFAGYAIGKVIGKMIDGTTGQVISGLGADPNSMGAKAVKPIVLIAVAIAVNLSFKESLVKNLSYGVGILGVEEGVKALTGKTTLFGILGGDEDSVYMPEVNLHLPTLEVNENEAETTKVATIGDYSDYELIPETVEID